MGLGLFWKERGPSSSQYLGTLKRKLAEQNFKISGPSRKGIGHGGTLDPFAEGWLLVGWDEGTKLLGALKGLSKTYVAEIYLGASTDTLDDTVTAEKWNQKLDLNEEKLKLFLKEKIGVTLQKPPLYSAKKVEGKSSYEAIRRGVELDLKPVSIEVFEAEHLGLIQETDEVWRWTVKLRVSAGTYIRAFARDWAMELFGKTAFLSRLARVGYGSFCELSNERDRIVSDNKELSAFFDFVSDEKIHPQALADRGHLLLDEQNQIRAAWLVDAERWRYFTSNPLS
ncbi:MAG: hypothetical protein R3A80_12575 [Bdellovibrionota bacterium]